MTSPTDFVYRATVIQYAPTDGPDYLWANTWEFTSPAGFLGDEAAGQAVADAFANFHRRLLLPNYGVDRVVLSTYGPDLPAPAGFSVYPYRSPGVSTASGRPLPLTVVAFVRKNVARGRDGKIFLRGVLTTNSLAGEEFTNQFGVNFPGALETASGIFFSALQNAQVRLVLASGPVAAVQTREVLGLDAVNARSLQYRTRRKTRLQQNAVENLVQAFADGAVAAGEAARVIQSLRRLFPSADWPQLPPP